MSVEYKGKIYQTKIKDGLITLDLSKKGIYNLLEIKGLEEVINLQRLILNDNSIIDISNLASCDNLVELYLKNNNIQEIKGLQNCTKLRVIKVNGNPIYKWAKKNLKIPRDYVQHCRLKDKNELKKEVRTSINGESFEVILKEFSEKLDDIKSDTEVIKEYTSQIEQIFNRVDDLESFLIKKLGNDFQKIQTAWNQYKEGKIGKAGLIKEGLRVIGKNFIKKILIL